MSSNESSMVLSYLSLRKTVGLLGVALPLLLPIGLVVLGVSDVWQATISDYVGTLMRGVFVGVLFAIGIFLYSYKGYERADDAPNYEPSDNIAGNLACAFALGVALFPTNSGSGFVRTVHVVSAVGFFLTVAYFSLWLFPKTGGVATPEKMARNKVYRFSGVVILVCIGLIGLNGWLLRDSSIASINPVFWLEAIALWAFGWAWFVKGEGLTPLNDRDG